MKLVLWGAGGHGAVVLDAVQRQGTYEAIGFLDDGQNEGTAVHRSGLPVFYGRHHLKQLREEGIEHIVIAIGNEDGRSELATVATNAGFSLATVIHPSAVICRDVGIGWGTVVFAGAVVQTGCRIGQNVIVNTCASVDHDSLIGDGAQLAPRVALGGRVKIGALTFVGIGATVMNGIEIGRNCVIGAGAVVVRNIPDHRLAYGVPARVVRERKAG